MSPADHGFRLSAFLPRRFPYRVKDLLHNFGMQNTTGMKLYNNPHIPLEVNSMTSFRSYKEEPGFYQ